MKRLIFYSMLTALLAMFTSLLSIAMIDCTSFTEAAGSPVYGDIMVTAAHIPSTEFPAYTLIYTDKDNDKAYYILNSYTPNYLPEGVTVTFGDTLTGTVVRSEGIELYIKPDKLDAITKGISGSHVIYDNTPYAFVSALTSEGLILCIYY